MDTRRPVGDLCYIVQESCGSCLYKNGGRGIREKWIDMRCVVLLIESFKECHYKNRLVAEKGGLGWITG